MLAAIAWGITWRGAFAASLALIAWAAWLDLGLEHQLEIRRWSVPASIYASPLELHPGRSLTPDELVDALHRSGYRPVRARPGPGRYSRNGSRLRVGTRAFTYWDRAEPARDLRVVFSGARVADLRDGKRPLAAARIDPPEIGRIYPHHHEDRELRTLDDMPPTLLAGLVAVEDQGFWSHHGISPSAVARALWANVRAGTAVQGASTLTQQLAKNFFLSPDRTLWRKGNEALIALLLEARFSKRAILEAYINEIFLGQQGARAVHGFGIAARYYFSRPVDELALHEQALLIALVRGASYYNPRRHPERARARRDLVLDLMASRGVIGSEAAARARRAGLGVTAKPAPSRGAYPAFLDLVRRQLRRDHVGGDLREAGLRVFTTLDPLVQESAQAALGTTLDRLEKRGGAPLQGAVTVTDAATGEVLAVVGDRNPRRHGFNRALDAVRPIGSLVKPAVYLRALEMPERFTLATPIADAPIRLRAGERTWAPSNYDGKIHGQVPMHEALSRSLNLATVGLGLELGLDAVVGTLRRLGVERPLERYPSLLLGASALAPIEVNRVYQTFASGGFRMRLRSIRAVTDGAGRPIASYRLKVEPAITAEAAHLITRGLVRVMRHGTGRGAYRVLPASLEVAGKTGTTDGLRDSWFAGFTGDRVAVAWVGNDDNAPTGLTGSRGALAVWSDLMRRIRPSGLSAEPPDGVETHWALGSGGALTQPGCAGAVPLPFVAGSLPPFTSCAATARSVPAEVRPSDDRPRGEG